ncbi:hypothetical protein K474DRAFT_1570971, partial [Panus rudis PR-1116 ss-1]
QRLLAFYFKFKGLSARGCDALHSLGVTLSSRWINKAIVKTSSAVMEELRVLIFSPAFNKQAPDGHGTVAIAYYRADAPVFPPSVNRQLQKQKRIGMQYPIGWDEVEELARQNYPIIQEFMVYEALDILLQSDEFSLNTYKHRKDRHIQPPQPIRSLPIGPDHITRQFMLPTMPIPEQSYDDNLRVMERILKQLGFDTNEKLQKLGLDHLVFWLGDQLTVQRIRGAQRMRCQDFNSTDRLDYSLPIWQWLHLLMALEKSLHKQFLGSDNGFGFLRAFSLFGRIDLIKSGTEGPFHERFEHVLRQVIIAYVRECWLVIARDIGIDRLENLRNIPPSQLRDLARKLVDTFASSEALYDLRYVQKDE